MVEEEAVNVVVRCDVTVIRGVFGGADRGGCCDESGVSDQKYLVDCCS